MCELDKVLAMLDILQELGSHAETNSGYQCGLYAAISRSGKDMTELTVGELLTICREHNAVYNRIHGAQS